MRCGFEVGSCIPFFTREASHTHAFFSYLCFNLSGQCDTFSTARSVFEIAAYSVSDTQKQNGLKLAAHLCSDVKKVLHIALLPQKSTCLNREIRKFERGVFLEEWDSACLHATSVVNQTLSLTTNLFFKPFKLIGKAVDLGEMGRKLGEVSKACSLVKSGTKILWYISSLYLGTDNFEKKIVKLALLIWRTIHKILKLADHALPIPLRLAHNTVRTLFRLIIIWQKTA